MTDQVITKPEKRPTKATLDQDAESRARVNAVYGAVVYWYFADSMKYSEPLTDEQIREAVVEAM